MKKTESIFPFIIVLVSGVALLYPPLFLWVKPYISVLLGMIMFSIGMTLDFKDFQNVFALKWKILILAILKYLTLPFFALVISYIFPLSRNEFIGLMIVSACPGGTAASVMAYLSRSNVALTVTLTLLTTLISPLATPAIIYFFLHEYIEISFFEIAHTIFWIVLFPLLDGLVIRRFLGSKIEKIRPILPVFSMLAITLIIASIVAMNHQNILLFPAAAACAVLTLNLGGLYIGYLLSNKLLRLDSASSRAVAFEFGIFDSAIGVMLATKFFGIATALSGVLMSIVQNVSGILMVRIFRSNKKTEISNKHKCLYAKIGEKT